jgi:methylated-DNA-[protein]-cysteine S-methyltransferase
MKPFYLSTPFSWLRIECSADQLLSVEYVKAPRSAVSLPDNELARRVQAQVQRYCQSGDAIFDLPLCLRGTPFQLKVWRALQAIPAGEVRSYGEIARRLGTSPRAVGNACHANPVPLIIPCHRVVAATGIGGFSGATSGSRIMLKRRLLAHEGVEI